MRAEYWWFILFVWVGGVVAGLADQILFSRGTGASPSPLYVLFSLATLVPSVAAGWRRMHDTGRSGIYLLYPLTIMIGLAFFLSVFQGSQLDRFPALDTLAGVVVLASGLLFLLSPLIVLWWLVSPSQPGPNTYGPNPHEVMP